MEQLRADESVAARALEFTILTAVRSGEAKGARWSEFHLTAKLWTIPAERMKAGKEHRVPLSARALEIVELCHEKTMQATFSSVQKGTRRWAKVQ